jgi:hypothetical protein
LPATLLKGFSLRLAALTAAALGMLAVSPATASAVPRGATMFVHSAKSGELHGGRLTLRGVGRDVTWVSNGGKSGVVSVARLHRRLFSPGTPPAAGTLHIAGQRPGRELALKLSRPRYDASRHRVSYRVKRLNKRPASSRVARASQRAAPRRFGPASLSIIGAPPVLPGSFGGNDCRTTLENGTGLTMFLQSSSKWDTDSWNPDVPEHELTSRQSTTWESDGGTLRGCSNTAVWNIFYPDGLFGTVTITTTYRWAGTPTYTCTPTGSQPEPPLAVTCHGGQDDVAGMAFWVVSIQ